MKKIKFTRLTVLLLLSGLCITTQTFAAKKYTYRYELNANEWLGLNPVFGIRTSTGKGRKVTIRVYRSDRYNADAVNAEENLQALIFGTSVEENSTSNYAHDGWSYSTTDPFCWLSVSCNSGEHTYQSEAYKHRIFQYYKNKRSATSGKQLEVIVELTLENDYSSINDIEDILLPDGKVLHPYDFTTSVKGINYYVRVAAPDSYLDSNPIEKIDGGTDYKDEYMEGLEITKSLHTNQNIKPYEIAIPRKILSNVFSKLPGLFKGRNPDSFVTNMVVYPEDDLSPNTNYWSHGFTFNVVSSSIDLTAIKNKLKVDGDNNSTIHVDTEVSDFFEAKVDDIPTSFHLYKVSVKNANRVFIYNIDNHGPFPASQKGLASSPPILAEDNRKMLAKSELSDNHRVMVAWHRGFWRDYPENTLQSITAAKTFLSTSDLLELDISRAGSINDMSKVHDYVLYHDPFMFRSSSKGPNRQEHQCVNPYDMLLVDSDMLSFKRRSDLRAILKNRFPGYSDNEYDDWIKAPSAFNIDQLTEMQVRDRFGCLTAINIPTLDQGIDKAKENHLPIMVDKGWDDIDGIYWHAIEKNYEDNVFFKGGDSRQATKLTKMYGDDLFRQIVYTPFYFDNKAQNVYNKAKGKNPNISDDQVNLPFLQEFLDKEISQKWIVPGFELQVKMRENDGSYEDGFNPDGTRLLVKWAQAHKEKYWIGITQINPTARNGFDNKVIWMNAGDNRATAPSYSSRYDRRADMNFNVNYLGSDYWTTDRPDMVVQFLRAIGKISN